MLKKIALVVIVLLAALVGFASMKPDTFHIERTATIGAPPEKVFALVQDFHQWGAWSPWEKLDPAMKRTHSGAPSGKGAVYEWEGNSDVGQGRMEILEATPISRVSIKLDFIKPFEASNTAVFNLTPEGGSTKVVWAMDGTNNFVSKVMQVFMDMDSLIGKDFEAGLANMKAAAEK